jgi:hypothetical protein
VSMLTTFTQLTFQKSKYYFHGSSGTSHIGRRSDQIMHHLPISYYPNTAFTYSHFLGTIYTGLTEEGVHDIPTYHVGPVLTRHTAWHSQYFCKRSNSTIDSQLFLRSSLDVTTQLLRIFFACHEALRFTTGRPEPKGRTKKSVAPYRWCLCKQVTSEK